MTPTVPEAARAPAAALLLPAPGQPVGLPVGLPADPAPGTRWRRPLRSSAAPDTAVSTHLGPGVGSDPDPGPGNPHPGLHPDDRGPRPMNLPAAGLPRRSPRTPPTGARPEGLPADPAPATRWRRPQCPSAAPDTAISTHLGPGVGSDPDPGPGNPHPGLHPDDRGPRPMNLPAAAGLHRRSPRTPPTVPEAARAPTPPTVAPPIGLPADPVPGTRWRRPLRSSVAPDPAISTHLDPGVGCDPDPGPGSLDPGHHTDDRGPRPMNLPAAAAPAASSLG